MRMSWAGVRERVAAVQEAECRAQGCPVVDPIFERVLTAAEIAQVEAQYGASQPPSGTPYLVGLPHMHHRGGGPYASGCDRIRLREVEKEVARASHSRPANCPSPTMVACFTAIFVDARGPKLTVCIDTPNYTDA